VVSVTNPYGRILAFLDWSRYYCFQVAPQLHSRDWGDPVPDQLHFLVPGIEPGTSGSAARKWPLDHRGGRRHPGCIYKMAKALRSVHTSGRGLVRGLRWSVGPKLIFDQMAAPVPEIMDKSLCRRLGVPRSQCRRETNSGRSSYSPSLYRLSYPLQSKRRSLYVEVMHVQYFCVTVRRAGQIINQIWCGWLSLKAVDTTVTWSNSDQHLG
jgi:hypothetical protein